jgi:signal transduction histidine kinase
MSRSDWSTQQLAEFVAAVSSARTEASAAIAAVERAAEALDAEVAAIVCGADVVAAVGYAEGGAPGAELRSVSPGAAAELAVPGVGVCLATSVWLEYPKGATLVLARSGPEGLSREEAALLRGMAHVTSMTMRMLRLLGDERTAREESDRQAAENARLLATLTERQTLLEQLAEEQAALRRVATLVAGQTGAEDIFAAVAEEAGRLLRADVGGVCRYEPDGGATIVAAWSAGDVHVPVGRRIPLDGESATAIVLRSGTPARLDSYDGRSGPLAELMRGLGIHSSVGAPIIVDGRVWGAMITSSTRPEPLPSDSEQRLAAFTELVATALSNAQARADLARLADEQAALRRVATLVARAVPPEDVFAAVTEEVARLVGADRTVMVRREMDDDDTVVALWSADGVTDPLRGRCAFSEPAWMSLLDTGHPSRLQLPAADSLIACPIVVEKRIWGAILASSDRREPFPDDTESRIMRFTELVATAISNAASRAQLAASRARIVATADETRRRIERDLHDGIQQRLVTLALELRSVKDSVAPEGQQLLARVSHVEDGLTGVLDELREIARGVHPAILSRGGLGAALKSLARRSALPVELHLGAVGRLPGPAEVAVYYVVCEALANAAKHAKASAARVDVEVRDGTLLASICDDGVGGADPAKGSGILGLTDRVEALDGTLAVTSPAGEGTSMIVELPIDSADRHVPPAA